MNTTIHLDPAMVPRALRGSYTGKMFKAMVTTSTTIPMDAGLWSGGSRDKYYAIELATGDQAAIPGQEAAPWNEARRDIAVDLRPGFAIVRHSVFCGKDTGLTFYVHPNDAAAMLPAPATELTAHEQTVLNATCMYKSSYGGKDRYEMARPSSWEPADKITAYPTRAQWDEAKAALIARGLLNKAGAVTVAGRNARTSI